MRVADALVRARALGVDRLDAQLLLARQLRQPRSWLIAHDDHLLSQADEQALLPQLQQRAAGVPLAYLLGEREFHGLMLQVSPAVLVPRPETEHLVDWALACLAGRAAPRVIDLGTGSGAIALALQHERRDASVLAVDASADALAVARANAERLGLPVRLQHGNWLASITGPFDAIVSNPPYIPAQDPHLAALTHEPLSALASGADGLADIRAIIAQAPRALAPGGWLLIEHGWDQAPAVQALLRAAGLAQVQGRNDLAGIARCSGGSMPVGLSPSVK